MSDFWAHKRARDGLQSSCKGCLGDQIKAAYRRRYVPKSLPPVIAASGLRVCVDCSGEFSRPDRSRVCHGCKRKRILAAGGAERLREIQRASYRRHRESRIAAVNAYRHGSQAGAGSVGKRLRWIAESTDGTLTKSAIKALFTSARGCAYCASPINGKSKTLDHLEPVSRGGGHTAANVLICCKPCNSAKGSLPFSEWLDRLAARHGERAASRARRAFVRVTGRDPRQAPMPLLFCVAGPNAEASRP